MKLKMDGSIRWAASDPATPYFHVFTVFGPRGILVL
jgi:hypothetical protein